MAVATEPLNNSVRTSTRKQYKSKMKAFNEHGNKIGADPKTCHTNVITNVLTERVRDKELSFRTVGGYRSAIARQHDGVNGVLIGQLTQVKQLVRAIFVEKPPMPRYTEVWDVNKVLAYLEAGPSTADLSVMELSMKMATLTSILTLSRCTIISMIMPRI